MGSRAGARRWLPFGALFGVPVMFHLAIVQTNDVPLAVVPRLGVVVKLGVVLASAVTHWLIYGGLLLTFALTLRPGHEPLITAMTRRLYGSVSDELARYTRRVTIAWSCFFAAQLTTSVSLFLFAPLVDWSFFVNILDIPLVILMFAAEYAVRLRCLRDPPRQSLSGILAMIADMRKGRQGAAGVL